MSDFSCALNPFGILAIHASAVRLNGRALVFLGPSETGKSTICRLLSGYAEPLADDAVYLVPDGGARWAVADGTGRAFGPPLSKDEAYALRTTRLYAVFRLYRASEPCLEQIDSLQTCRCLINAFFEVGRHRAFGLEDKKRAFSRLASIARTVPGYHFYFDLSSHTLEMFSNEFNWKKEEQRNGSTGQK